MNRIGRVQFNFDMQNEQFAHRLYARWDPFFVQNFERIADEVLSKYDVPTEQIELQQLDLDLGTLNEEEFDWKFPQIIREKLEEALVHSLFDPQRQALVKRTPEKESRFKLLCHFLLHGSLPWSVPQAYKDIHQLFMQVVQSSGKELKQFLQTYGHYTSLCERLVYQLHDRELEQGVHLLAPSESTFICSYISLLISKHRQMEQPVVRETDYHQAVWLLVYAYLLNNRSSYFNKKSFLSHTIVQLAAKYSLTYYQLLDSITRELSLYFREHSLSPQLFLLLNELRKELTEKNFKESALSATKLFKTLSVLFKKNLAKEVRAHHRNALIEMLAQVDSCRSFLQLLTEEEIIRLVPVVVPQESDFVIAYARSLDVQQQKGSLEGKAGGEFSKLKWLILFPLLLENRGAAFNRKYFVLAVLRKIAAHYNLYLVDLLGYFFKAEIVSQLDSDLERILRELYSGLQAQAVEQQKGTAVDWVAVLLDKIHRQATLSALESKRLLKWLAQGNPTRRRMVGSLQEEERHQLIRLLFPSESTFISAYAKALDHQQAYGALEGKAVGEFQQLKWEFILAVLTESTTASFNHQQLVSVVLKGLSAHYNLTYLELLYYFHEQRKLLRLPAQLAEILDRLFLEEREQVIEQLVQTPYEKDKYELVSTLFPAEKNFVITYAQALDKHGQGGLEGKSGGEFRQMKWKFIFALLFESQGRAFNRKHFVEHVLTKLSAHYNLDVSDLLDYFYHAIPAHSFPSDWMNMLKELYEEYLPADKHRINIRKTTKIQTKDMKEHQPNKAMDAKSTSMEKENGPESDRTNLTYINNAGIVLLLPFLPRLFSALGLTDAGQFKNRDAQIRAMFLLQYAAFGKTEFPEHELTLNKLLTGFQIGVPIPRSIELSGEERQTVDSMLRSVLQNWRKLQNTSIEGLQISFLQREGRLETKDNCHLLTVEQKAYDLLLDSIPWSYTLIKYSWMEKMISVKWR